MASDKILDGVAHKLPTDLKKSISAPVVVNLWNGLTPLARNEFICWVEDAKKPETRQRRITRTVEELREGKRRPCCWIGCIHRSDKKISASVRGILKIK